ncbi:hypothetical protein V6N13_135031 [Hibiscus sabdariffa]
MASKASTLIFFSLNFLFFTLVSSQTLTPPSPPCSSPCNLETLNPCYTVVTSPPYSPTPTKDCCDALTDASIDCICKYFNGVRPQDTDELVRIAFRLACGRALTPGHRCP